MNNFTIGADPELFLKDLNGSFVSAHNLLPGTKEDPYHVQNGAVQVDGMAAEFNIDPAHNFNQFKGNLESVKDTLRSMIGDCEFLVQSSVEFDEKFISEIPTLNRELGCSVDYNAWDMCENPSPNAATLMRTAGGHIHIGGFTSDNEYDPEHFERCAYLARLMDEAVGVPSIMWDNDDKRRSMYGQAGAFRPKTYGMEYRTLSNRWIFNDSLIKFVYENTMKAVDKFVASKHEPSNVVRNIINNSDRNHPMTKDWDYLKGAA